jgi:GST-like protein
MIDLYTWPTPNGHKVHIMLEEVGLEYRVIPVNINKGDQFEQDFLAISPNNKMPAMIDHDGPGGESYSLFESGAILMWLMFQMGGIGPLLGQTHHFRVYAPEQIPYAVDRYTNEAARLYTVMDHRLADSEFLAGEYSIADIACFPWLRRPERQGQRHEDFPNLKRWFDTIAARPAVQRGVEVLAEHQRTGAISAEARENLFGATQYQKR